MEKEHLCKLKIEREEKKSKRSTHQSDDGGAWIKSPGTETLKGRDGRHAAVCRGAARLDVSLWNVAR